jgi:polysaccharide lyase-like protein/List-Bact-rpt repeat protein
MTSRSEGKRALAMLGTCAGLLLASGGLAPGAHAQTASAAPCGGTSATPSARTVRRGGQVLVSGQACEGDVTISLLKGKRWVAMANASTVSGGAFAACVPVRVAASARTAKLRASGSGGTSSPVKVLVSRKGGSPCQVPDSYKSTNGRGQRGGGGGGGTTSPMSYTLTVSASGNGGVSGTGIACPGDCSQSYTSGTVVALVATPASGSTFTGWGGSCSGTGGCSVTMSAARSVTASFATAPSGGLSVLRQDDASNPDPMPLWNEIMAQDSSRHQQFSTGGPTGGAFRRLTVLDGDNVWGERAELAHNARLGGLGAPWGTFFLYGENERRVTQFQMRLPTDFPINTNSWQVVMQMKQTGPSANSGGTPVLALEARQGRWVLTQSDSAGASSNTHEVWSTPASLGVWTPISLDVTYSPNPSVGKVQITVGGVQSPTFTTFTQKYEISPGSQGLLPGDAIPSHLRLGIYHDTALPGTHVDFANVKVLG